MVGLGTLTATDARVRGRELGIPASVVVGALLRLVDDGGEGDAERAGE